MEGNGSNLEFFLRTILVKFVFIQIYDFGVCGEFKGKNISEEDVVVDEESVEKV